MIFFEMASQPSVIATSNVSSSATNQSSPLLLLPPQSHREARRRISDGLVAVLIATVAQLLLAGIQYVLDERGVDFPPSIVAMTGIFIVFSVSGYFISGVEDFYRKRLRRAADLLNRHMSVGFTIPFIMILRGPLSDAKTIGAIIGCFILTGLLNTILAYIFAVPLQCLMVRWDKQTPAEDIESAPAATIASSAEPSVGKLHAPAKYLCYSMNGSVTFAAGDETPSDSDASQSAPTTPQETLISARVLSWALENPLILTFWLLTLILGLPIRSIFPSSPVFSTLLLFSFWLSTLAFQSSIKSLQSLSSWARILLSGLFNPVLFTTLGMAAYIFVDMSISHESLPRLLSSLQSNTTISSFILQPSPSFSQIKAGDIASSILNAGLVSWGLKLYEYRAQLLSRAGLTVFTVSSLLAVGNVICGPLLAHTVGVRPESRALAFAARSVTLALGNPVMQALGGDSGLNAAMVVVSGIVYQMGLGFGMGRWLVGVEGRQGEERGQDENDPKVVAAGVTVGVNAAAMGTAYLYEVDSEAAPYSALSMMALGIMTVVFSTISPLAAWVAKSVVS